MVSQRFPQSVPAILPVIELFESRTLLSASVVNGALTVTGTTGNDVIVLARSGSTHNVTLNGVTTPIAQTLTSITVNALAGHDHVTIETGIIGATLSGNQGNDTLIGGDGADRLGGGQDIDNLNGRIGRDTVQGGADIDIVRGGSGHDLLWGGPGADHLIGDAGNDTMHGNLGSDNFEGGTGNDVFFTADGLFDAILGDDGTDTAFLDDGLDFTASVEVLS